MKMSNAALMEHLSNEESKQQLYRILLEELSAYDYLAETVAEKQKAIVANDLEKIEQLSGVEQLVVNKANRLTTERYRALKQFMRAKNVMGVPVRLSAMIKMLNHTERSIWQRLEKRLYEDVEKIKRLNAQNMQLLDTSLRYVKGMIELFVPKDEHRASLYDNRGQDNAKVAARNMLDCNA